MSHTYDTPDVPGYVDRLLEKEQDLIDRIPGRYARSFTRGLRAGIGALGAYTDLYAQARHGELDTSISSAVKTVDHEVDDNEAPRLTYETGLYVGLAGLQAPFIASVLTSDPAFLALYASAVPDVANYAEQYITGSTGRSG